MRVHFKDGTSEEADLVVGCDGIHSALRAQSVPDRPRYTGIAAYRAFGGSIRRILSVGWGKTSTVGHDNLGNFLARWHCHFIL